MELLMPGISLGASELIIIVCGMLLHLGALISLLRAEFRDSINKLIWLLVILFVPFFGALLYFIIGRKQRIKTA